MGPFEIAAIAIIGSFVTKIINTWLKTRGSEGSVKIRELEQRLQALEAQTPVKALQERVNTLEAIVTSDEFELHKKFQQLKD